MMKTVTEEDLGIAPTAEEMAAPPPAPEDDYPEGGADPEGDAGETEAKPVPEKDPATGRFVAKDGVKPAEAGGAAPPVGKPAEPVKPPPGFVDHRALAEARAENKLLMERMTALLEAQQQRATPAKPEAPAAPDLGTNPMGYIEDIASRLGKIEGETQAQMQARQEAEREQEEVGKALAVARPQFEEAAQADPSTTATYNALLESYAREIQFLNRNNPDFQRDPRGFLGREMSKLENGHIKFAVASGMNVAHYMRDLAASRGITGLASPGAPQAGQQQPEVRQPTIADRAAAQQRHMSLGDAPGGEAPTKIDAKTIAKMSPAQFAAYARKVGESGLDELMGKG